MKREFQEVTYSDLAFKPELDQNGDLRTVKDVNSIKQAIFTLFHTIPGSRVMMPNYGASLQPFLFEVFDEETAKSMYGYILEAIKVFEPRITVDKLNIKVFEESQTYEITLKYTIRANQTEDTISFQLEKL